MSYTGTRSIFFQSKGCPKKCFSLTLSWKEASLYLGEKKVEMRINHFRKYFHRTFGLSYFWCMDKNKRVLNGRIQDSFFDGQCDGRYKAYSYGGSWFWMSIQAEKTPFIVFFWGYGNLMQEAKSKIAKTKLHLQLLGSWLKPWWMESSSQLGNNLKNLH